MNIRLWKAQASEKLGVLKPRERAAIDYANKLKEKYSSHPEVSVLNICNINQIFFPNSFTMWSWENFHVPLVIFREEILFFKF